MRAGAWHQCGDRSQRLVEEQLMNGNGVGVILSPRDLPRSSAVSYTAKYRALGAEILLDQQFYVPGFNNRYFATYPICAQKVCVSASHLLSEAELSDISHELESDNRDLRSVAVLAPALIYEAGRPDIFDINIQLFRAAKRAGDSLGLPTYATVVIGHSLIMNDQLVNNALSNATSLGADGWYYGFEFASERVPSSQESISRFMRAGLALASTGLPLIHAYAGPLCLLSFVFGARAAAIGHSQNLWRFTRERWEVSVKQGGGSGDAPPRLFSKNLWGTIVYPDETSLLSSSLLRQIIQHSPYSVPVSSNTNWGRWDANKHLIHVLGEETTRLSTLGGPRLAAQYAIKLLQDALSLHSRILQQGITLRDSAAAYQANWLAAINQVLVEQNDDYDYLELIP